MLAALRRQSARMLAALRRRSAAVLRSALIAQRRRSAARTSAVLRRQSARMLAAVSARSNSLPLKNMNGVDFSVNPICFG